MGTKITNADYNSVKDRYFEAVTYFEDWLRANRSVNDKSPRFEDQNAETQAGIWLNFIKFEAKKNGHYHQFIDVMTFCTKDDFMTWAKNSKIV